MKGLLIRLIDWVLEWWFAFAFVIGFLGLLLLVGVLGVWSNEGCCAAACEALRSKKIQTSNYGCICEKSDGERFVLKENGR